MQLSPTGPTDSLQRPSYSETRWQIFIWLLAFVAVVCKLAPWSNRLDRAIGPHLATALSYGIGGLAMAGCVWRLLQIYLRRHDAPPRSEAEDRWRVVPLVLVLIPAFMVAAAFALNYTDLGTSLQNAIGARWWAIGNYCGTALLLLDAGILIAWCALAEHAPARLLSTADAEVVEASSEEAPLFDLAPEERAALAERALRFLSAEAGGLAPDAVLVRVGAAGVELLFSEAPIEVAPGFVPEAPRIWRLADLDLLDNDLPTPSGTSGTLRELGEDAESTYFLPIEDDDSTLAEAPNSSLGLLAPLDWKLIETEVGTILEPLGLALRTPTLGLEEDDAEEVATEQALCDERTGNEERNEVTSDGVDGLNEDSAPAALTKHPIDTEVSTEEALEQPSGAELLAEVGDEPVPPGPIEVRILRDEPALVGALEAEPTPAAIEFLAYLTLHGYAATSSRLRDSLGPYKPQASKSEKTIWTAAGAARKAIGQDRLPTAGGNQSYQLHRDVTCDWLRFGELVRIARTPGTGRERAREALSLALGLVEGIPAQSSRRFSWLDIEGFHSDIARAVAEAAAMLATILVDEGRAPEARTAIAKGLAFAPGDRVLADLEHRLLHAS